MIFMSKRILAAACAAATALTLSACISPSTSNGGSSKDGKLTVMASFYPLQYLAEKIGGEHVSVTSLTPDGAEPHDLELSPKMVDSLSSADAVVYLAGFQSAVDEAIEQQAPKTVIDVSSAAELIEVGTDANHPSEDEEEATDETQSGETEAHEHDHEGHDHEGHDHHHDMSADPHFWLDPTRMAKAATLVGDKLAEADSAHADAYKANAKALAEELNTLSDTLVTKTSNCKVKTFVTAHTAFG
ncbi:MAG: metal ABC transporter substrate-binding protein, partial [Actinomyces sp.]